MSLQICAASLHPPVSLVPALTASAHHTQGAVLCAGSLHTEAHPARGYLCSSGQRSLPSSPAGQQAAQGRSCSLALSPLPSPYLDPQGTRSHLSSTKSLTLLMNACQTLVPTTSSWPSPILEGGTVILKQVRPYRPSWWQSLTSGFPQGPRQPRMES